MTKFPSAKDVKKMREKYSTGMASRPLSKTASTSEKIKHAICQKLVIYKNDQKITQKEMAKIIGIDESLVSKILHYHYDEFTIDRLVKYLEKLYEHIDIKLDVA